jgi:hypothetical protein
MQIATMERMALCWRGGRLGGGKKIRAGQGAMQDDWPINLAASPDDRAFINPVGSSKRRNA